MDYLHASCLHVQNRSNMLAEPCLQCSQTLDGQEARSTFPSLDWQAPTPVTWKGRCCRYITGFNGFGGSNFSTAAQYTAFANTTMLQRLSALISNGTTNGGNAPLIGEWGLAGAH